MISVDEVMTTDVFTLKSDNSVYDARTLMNNKDIRHIPIVDEKSHLVGIISQRDILAASESTLHASSDEQRMTMEKKFTLNHVMTRKVNTIEGNDSLRSAAVTLRRYKHGCLPVLKKGKLTGIITDTDFIGVALHLLEQVESSVPIEEF